MDAKQALEILRRVHREHVEEHGGTFLGIKPTLMGSHEAPGWQYVIAEDRVERINEAGSA